MPNIWFTAGFHLGHRNIIRYLFGPNLECSVEISVLEARTPNPDTSRHYRGGGALRHRLKPMPQIS
jgi:hypothetical protein